MSFCACNCDGCSTLDALKLTRSDGSACWRARDLQLSLRYARWSTFVRLLAAAMCAARNLGWDVDAHFRPTSRPSKTVFSGDYHLTAEAAYLLVLKADPAKGGVAASQHYFGARLGMTGAR